MIGAWTYAVAVNFVPSYRDPADKIGESTIGIVDPDVKKDEEYAASADHKDEHPTEVEVEKKS